MVHAWSLASRGDQEAVEAAVKALQIDPDSAEAHRYVRLRPSLRLAVG